MKFLCTRTCQITDDNEKIILIEQGSVIDSEKNPKKGCFKSLDGEKGETHKIDFTTASEDELLSAKWSVAVAKEEILKAYKVELKIKSDDKKSDVVDRILDIRYRNNSIKPTG